jgi:hypothetical protein
MPKGIAARKHFTARVFDPSAKCRCQSGDYCHKHRRYKIGGKEHVGDKNTRTVMFLGEGALYQGRRIRKNNGHY